MRVLVAMAVAGIALAGCQKKDGGPVNAQVPMTNATPAVASTGAPAGFSPPTTISRAEYGGRMERRFRKLDKDGDGKLQRTELPQKRADRIVRRMDSDGDGVITSAEWSAGMLARFDKQDANRDGNLTSDERGKRGKKGGGRKRDRQQAAEPIDDDGDEVDNGM